jgi:hypothetical protein
MKLVLTRPEAIKRINEFLKTQEVGGGFFKLTTMDAILGEALKLCTPAQIENLVKDLGGVSRVFNVQGDVELSIN